MTVRPEGSKRVGWRRLIRTSGQAGAREKPKSDAKQVSNTASVSVVPRTHSGGNAIKSRSGDRLGRSKFADHLAVSLLQESAEEGLVAALIGSWGLGKTSVLNMVQEQLEGEYARTVLAFNPWMFSGRDQLVSAFFEQVAGQLSLKGKPESVLADRFLSYGQALSPLVFLPHVGPWIKGVSAVASVITVLRKQKGKPIPVEMQRAAIETELGKLAEPIFVFIDDIDRLTAPEIRDMFGLVRLTAHFPKIVYVLAFDRVKVERALQQDGLDDGRGYLDKIVELPIDLPATSYSALRSMLLQGLEDAVSAVDVGPFDQALWADVLTCVLVPLLTTPRDVNRYLAALPAALRMIGDEVALVDVLALEAVRLRMPEVFSMLGPMSKPLTDLGMLTSQVPGWQEEITAFVQAGGNSAPIVSEMCRLLFPATTRYLGNSNTTYPSSWLPTWRKQRRVASPEVLATYLSKQLPAGALPAATMDAVVLAMPHKRALEAIVQAMSPEDLDDLLARIIGYVDDIPLEAVQPACTVLLDLYPRLRASSQGIFDMGSEIGIDRVVLRLLRRVADDDKTRVVEALCADVAGLTGKIRLLRAVGRRPNPQMDRLIPIADSDRLYREVCREIRHATVPQIVSERDALELLAIGLEEKPADRENIDQILADDDVAQALLLSARSQIREWSTGSIATEVTQVLHWQLLGTVVGDDSRIADLVDRVGTRFSDDEATAAVVELARRYLTGWRPPDARFGRREPAIRQAGTTPNMFFSPPLAVGWPALLVRAAASYEVDPAWAEQGDVSGAEFHRRLAQMLADLPLAVQTAALAKERGLPVDFSGWTPDKDVRQSERTAVERHVIGPIDPPTAVLRYAVLLQGNSLKVVTDIAVSPTQDTDEQWGLLNLDEVRHILETTTEAVAGPTTEQMLGSIYAGEVPPRTTIELYLWSAEDTTGHRSSNTLNSTIDLSPLGPPARADQPPRQGMFAAAGDTPTATAQERLDLVVYALIRMSLDWGYLDARAQLIPLMSG